MSHPFARIRDRHPKKNNNNKKNRPNNCGLFDYYLIGIFVNRTNTQRARARTYHKRQNKPFQKSLEDKTHIVFSSEKGEFDL